MNLKTKQQLDNLIGQPILFGLKIVARLLGKLLKRNHSRHPVRAILILKFQGMGSLALAKPALVVLRKQFPDAKIIFWGTAGTSCLAELMPEFDNVVTLRDKGIITSLLSLSKNLLSLWKENIDWAFDLEVYSKLSSILTTASLARNRAGFAVEPVRARKNIHTHLMMFNRYWYLGDAYSRLIGMITTAAVPNTPVRKERIWDQSSYGAWKFPLRTVEKIDNEAIRSCELKPKKYIVINLHSGPLALERRWPIQHFFSYARWYLESYPDEKVILIGHGPEEEKISQSFYSHKNVVSLAGKISLAETIELLADAALVISNDTAALHLALTSTVPVIGLFGPTRAKSYFPSWRPNGIAMTRDFYCSPCVHHWTPPPCGGMNYCMFAITANSVQKATEALKNSKNETYGKDAFLSGPVTDPIESSILEYYQQGLVNHPELPGNLN